MKNYFVIIVSIVVFAFSANGQEENLVITSKDVTHFIKNAPAIKSDMEELNMDENWFNEDYTIMYEASLVTKIDKVVKKYGYSSYSDFVLKATSIAMAYAAVEYAKEMNEQQPEIQQALKDIENNEALTKEQKESMKQMFSQGLNIANQTFSEVPEENKAVVKSHLDELKELLENL